MGEKMEQLSKGKNKEVQRILRWIGKEKIDQVEEYLQESIQEEYQKFTTKEQIEQIASISSFKEEQLERIREYSRWNYRHINHAIRGKWSYEEDGAVKYKQQYLESAMELEKIIGENPTYLGNFRAYRGVPLSYFHSYGITSLEELKNLQDQFLWEQGFTSTSLLEKNSFFKKQNNSDVDYQIQIEYLIGKDFQDGIYLRNDLFSSYSDENEFLLNQGQLSKVLSVKVNPNSTALITTLVIPKEIYDPYYQQNNLKGKQK